MKSLVFLVVLIVSFSVMSCGSTKKTKKVNRIDSNEQVDLSGDWNRTDFKLASKELLTKMLSMPWLQKATDKKGAEPTIIVGKLKNKTADHIPMDLFKEEIEEQLVNSGVLEFVAGKGDQAEIRDVVEDQLENASDDTQKGPGKEIGADYLLIGTINSLDDRSGGTKEKYFQISFSLLEVGTNKIVWKGKHEITKIIKQKKRTW